MKKKYRLAILGTGNIGSAIAKGLINSGQYQPKEVILTRRKIHLLKSFKKQGFHITADNKLAVKNSKIILVCVEPQHIDEVLKEIGMYLENDSHLLISVVSGVTIQQMRKEIKQSISIVRAMPNTAVSIRESITCIVFENEKKERIQDVRELFDLMGKTMIIDEEQMTASTSLGACGIAFFLRAIRAASQGGIEVGFHSEEALIIAAQTARGAASLLLNCNNHPESEIDKVTTPRGCTISGLNQMEHEGFSSALIKGIVTSANKAAGLYLKDKNE